MSVEILLTDSGIVLADTESDLTAALSRQQALELWLILCDDYGTDSWVTVAGHRPGLITTTRIEMHAAATVLTLTAESARHFDNRSWLMNLNQTAEFCACLTEAFDEIYPVGAQPDEAA